MRRWMLVAGLALLVSFPVAQALTSCTAAVVTTGQTTWLVALADVLTALVALSCCISVLVLLGEDRERRLPKIPLYDWRFALTRRRIRAAGRIDPTPS